MRQRIALVISALSVAVVLSVLLSVTQGVVGAQEPDESIEVEAVGIQEAIDAGPPAYLAPAHADSVDTAALTTAEGPLDVAVHTTSFTYQGRLMDGGKPAEGSHDLRFILYDTDEDGSQVGDTITEEDVEVAKGLFVVDLNFGSGVFTGLSRYLEVAVRPGDSTGTYTVLAPRQRIAATPYASYAYDADRLDGKSASSFASAFHDHDSRYFVKREGTQFTSSVSKGQSKSWFTFGWPTDEIVHWSVHPTTSGGRLDWSVDVELTSNGTFTYHITVTNRGSATTSFAAKYVRW